MIRENTLQRNSINNYLKKNTSHPTINDIYQAVSKDISSISLTAVDNTLSLMKQEGLIRELIITNENFKRYDANVLPHAHLICKECSKIIDADLPPQAVIPEKQKPGLDVQIGDVYIYGLCSACKKKKKKFQPQLIIIPKPTHMHFIVTGKNTKENVIQYLEDIHRESTARNYKKILIEERLEGERLGIMDVFSIAHEASTRGKGFYNAIAYVDVNTDNKLLKFAEDVTSNRALPMTVFLTVEEAEKWLISEE
ncbi:MAG: transcriptional repressor [Syntrophaceae bacterium]|nr:transcriptional repressor [Syntrophaceae bacterium]